MNINQAIFYVGTSTIESSCRLPIKTVTRQLCYSTLHHYALFLRPEVKSYWQHKMKALVPRFYQGVLVVHEPQCL